MLSTNRFSSESWRSGSLVSKLGQLCTAKWPLTSGRVRFCGRSLLPRQRRLVFSSRSIRVPHHDNRVPSDHHRISPGTVIGLLRVHFTFGCRSVVLPRRVNVKRIDYTSEIGQQQQGWQQRTTQCTPRHCPRVYAGRHRNSRDRQTGWEAKSKAVKNDGRRRAVDDSPGSMRGRG